MSTNVVSFVEETCFSGETFRSVRREIQYSIVGYGKGLGREFREDFPCDNGIWYDYEDKYLLSILEEKWPDINWGWFVLHKKMDHSAIEIIDPDSGNIVGSIHVRRGTGKKLSGEITCANVVSWNTVQQKKVERDERRAAEESTPEDVG